jgi:hypothetical protein
LGSNLLLLIATLEDVDIGVIFEVIVHICKFLK